MPQSSVEPGKPNRNVIFGKPQLELGYWEDIEDFLIFLKTNFLVSGKF